MLFDLALFILIVVSVDGLQFMGRALSFDWHFRSHILPPFRETLNLRPNQHRGEQDRITLEFPAFGKSWKATLSRNHILYTNRSSVTSRDINGNLRQRYRVNTDCYYIGSVVGGTSEYGQISLSTCNDKIAGLLITNINDYVIYANGWKKYRVTRSTHKIPDIRLEIANTTEYDAYMGEIKTRLDKLVKDEQLARVKRNIGDSEVPKFHKLDPPSGKNVYLELGIVVDKHYIRDYQRMISNDRRSLIHHVLLAYNNAQLWYIHPTFGLQLWLVIKDIVFVENQDIPLVMDSHTVSNPAALCKWVRKTLREQEKWDEVMILSSKPGMWNGRVGLAQRSGVCSSTGSDRCAGISHVNFQMASFARLIVHEAMHPLGVPDDYEGRTSLLCYSGIMRRGVWQDHDWSVCAVQAFEKWAGTSSSTCISRDKTPTLDSGFTVPLVPENIAWRANAVQSSTYKSEVAWGAWKATDGPITGIPKLGSAKFGSCTHTLRENRPWIRVDLDEKYSSVPIQAIVVYNRDDCCADRLRNFEVRVGDNTDFALNPLCAYHKQAVSGGRNGAAVFTCKRLLKGRFVSVQIMERNAILTVCEIQVMAYVRPTDFNIHDYSCRDHNSYCPYWGRVGECSRTGQDVWMSENCPHTCGLCRRQYPHTLNQNAPYEDIIYPVTASPNEDCVDSHESCLHFAANGDCEIDLDTRGRCPRSCGLCNTTILHHRRPNHAKYVPRKTIRLTTITTIPTSTITTTTPTTIPTTTPYLTTTKPTSTTSTTLTTSGATTTAVKLGTTTSMEFTSTDTSRTREARYTSQTQPVDTTTTRPSLRRTYKSNRVSPPLLPNKRANQKNRRKPEEKVEAKKPVGRKNNATNHQPNSELSRDGPANTNPSNTEVVDRSSRRCKDKSRYCKQWVNMGYCNMSRVISGLCQDSCNLCHQTSQVKPLTGSCVDTSTYCVSWIQQNPRSCQSGRIIKECMRTCGKCSDRTSTSRPRQANPRAKNHAENNEASNVYVSRYSSYTTSKPTVCVDQHKECDAWKRLGHCTVKSVQKLCRLSCNVCHRAQTRVSSCANAHKSCESWAKNGHCRMATVSRFCKKSCKLC